MSFFGRIVLVLVFASVGDGLANDCPQYPSCTWQSTEDVCNSTVIIESPCPGGRSSCFTEIDGAKSCCCIKYNLIFKHLEKGAAKPPLDSNRLRMYFLRFCPYCHRVALVSYAKNITTDIVFVSLRKNPEWFNSESELGRFVPTVETDVGHFNGSLIVSDFLDEAYPTPGELYSSSYVLKAVDRVLIENFNKDVPAVFSKIVGKAPKTDAEVADLVKQFEGLLTVYANELTRRGTTYFAGNKKPGMVDYMIWPWMERKPVVRMFFPAAFDYSQTSQRLAAWTDLMKKDYAVRQYGVAPEIHYEFIKSVIDTNDMNPKYNLLAEE